MEKLIVTELSEAEMDLISAGYRTRYVNMDLSRLVSIRLNIGVIVVAASAFYGHRTLSLRQNA